MSIPTAMFFGLMFICAAYLIAAACYHKGRKDQSKAEEAEMTWPNRATK